MDEFILTFSSREIRIYYGRVQVWQQVAGVAADGRCGSRVSGSYDITASLRQRL